MTKRKELKKCPYCDTFFFSNKDLEAHKKTHWRPSSNGKGEWMPTKDDPYLTRLLMNVGRMIRDGYRYTLIDNKIIYREPVERRPY